MTDDEMGAYLDALNKIHKSIEPGEKLQLQMFAIVVQFIENFEEQEGAIPRFAARPSKLYIWWSIHDGGYDLWC